MLRSGPLGTTARCRTDGSVTDAGRRQVMNCDQIEDKWEQLKGRAKATCGRLTRDWGRVATVVKDRLVGTAWEPNRVASGGTIRGIGRQPQGTVVPRTSAVPSPFRELAWLGLGAGLMYYLDPDRGR